MKPSLSQKNIAPTPHLGAGIADHAARETAILSERPPQKRPTRPPTRHEAALLNSERILLQNCDSPTSTHQRPRAPCPACPANTPAMRLRVSSSLSLSLSRSCTGNRSCDPSLPNAEFHQTCAANCKQNVAQLAKQLKFIFKS